MREEIFDETDLAGRRMVIKTALTVEHIPEFGLLVFAVAEWWGCGGRCEASDWQKTLGNLNLLGHLSFCC